MSIARDIGNGLGFPAAVLQNQGPARSGWPHDAGVVPPRYSTAMRCNSSNFLRHHIDYAILSVHKHFSLEQKISLEV
jgi:hypothetical protein